VPLGCGCCDVCQTASPQSLLRWVVRLLVWSVSLLGLIACQTAPTSSEEAGSVPETGTMIADALSPPDNLTAQASSGKVVLQWNPVAGAESYTLYWSLTASAQASKVIYELSEPTYIHVPPENGITYHYRVAAVAGAQSSPLSDSVSAVPLASPESVQAQTTETAIQLQWEAVAGARSYEVRWELASGESGVVRDLSELQYVQEPVESGVDYTFEVRACYDQHQGDPAVSRAVRALRSPRLASPWVQEGEVQLQWEPVAGASGYRLAQDNGTVGATWGTVELEDPVWTGQALANGRTYSFQVAAVHGVDQSPWSEPVAGTPLKTPDSLSVAVGDQTVWLQWEAVDQATSYTVQVDNGTGQYTKTVTGEDLLLEELENGRTYSFRVQAQHPTGQSNASASIPAIPLQSPQMKEVLIRPEQVELQWQEAQGAEHYQLRWFSSEDDTVHREVLDVPYFLHDSVETGVTYYYEVVALNATGTSDPISLETTPLGAPEALQAVPGNTEVSLSWNAVKGAEEYAIYRTTSAELDFSAAAIAVTADPSWLDEALANDQQVQYAVRAQRQGLLGPPSPTVAVTPSGELPRAPQGVQGVAASEQVDLSWQAVPGAIQYRVYWSETSGVGPDAASSELLTATNWTQTGLTNGERRYFRVQSVNAQGGGAFSQEVSSIPLATPTALEAEAGNQQVALSWTPVAGAEAYQVERQLAGGVWESVAVLPEATAWVETRLTNGQAVSYRVQAAAGSDRSAWSEVVQATPRLPAPDPVSVTSGNRMVTLSWDVVPGAERYWVYHAATAGVTVQSTRFSAGSQNRLTQTGLVNCQPVFFRVQAVGSQGQTSALSQEVQATPQIPESTDPLFAQQWYLHNTGQKAFASEYATPGVEIHLQTQASCYDGTGVLVAVVDNGLETSHEDLAANILPGGSWDFLQSDTDPSSSSGFHGTAVAGIIAAVDGNGLGGRGIAPGATLVGFNYLRAQTTSSFVDSVGGSTEAPNSAQVDVFNMSFGQQLSQDQAYSDEDPRVQALREGFLTLRGGKGALYLQASGNGFSETVVLNCGPANSAGVACQNSNMSPYAVTPYVLQVGAIGADGTHADYSASGSNLWVTAPGGGYGHDGTLQDSTGNFWDCASKPGWCTPALVTTDQEGCSAGFSVDASVTAAANAFEGGQHAENRGCRYTSTFNGTSASTAVVSGVVALLLEANPNLTARQVKHILARTSRQVDPNQLGVALSLADGSYQAELGWQVNAAGFTYHNWYGFGAVDADAAIAEALSPALRSFEPLEVCPWRSSGNVGVPIPDNSVAGAESAQTLSDAIHFLEAVQVTVTASHTHIGDLGIELVSPSGTRSLLLNAANGFLDQNLNGMTLLSNAFYGESGQGTWTLKLVDGIAEDTGVLEHWEIRLTGEGSCAG
jgi:subtilisin family serine protease/fibronectin type 3 domain-containing protein